MIRIRGVGIFQPVRLLSEMIPSKTPNASQQVMGRPRNEGTRELILKTTLSLLEKKTLQSISVEGIAKAAGVSKATIYRW